MDREEKNTQGWSFLGVVLLALLLPGMLRLVNSVTRSVVGAEGRLAAINIDSNRTLGPLSKNWLALSQGGENLKGFMDASSVMLSKLKPEYIRVNHVYDQFNVVGRSSTGLTYNWSELDLLVEKINSIGARPFFSLSYMPKVMAKDEDTMAEPTNWNEWSELVRKTIEHYSGEKGIDGVYYEIWNEPDLFGRWTMGGTKDYGSLYSYASYGATQVKGVKPFKIGGAATTTLHSDWVDEFFPYILKNNLRLDFFSWHRYDTDIEQYTEDINTLEKWIGKHPYFDKTERIISELGPNNEMGGVNDNNAGAAHLISVARGLIPKVKYGFNFSIWGNWGIMGKPRQKALEMLAELGNERLPITGEGSWVRAIAARDGLSYQVVMTNYDQKGIHSESVPVTFLNLKSGRYLLTSEILGETKVTKEVEATKSMIQVTVPMLPNSVVMLEIVPTSQSD